MNTIKLHQNKQRVPFTLLHSYDRESACKAVIKECRKQSVIETFFARYPELRNVLADIAYRITHSLKTADGIPIVASKLEIAVHLARGVINTGNDIHAKERQFLLTMSEISFDLEGIKISGFSLTSQKRMTWPGLEIPVPDWMRINEIQDIQADYEPTAQQANSSMSTKPLHLEPRYLFAVKVYSTVDLQLIADTLAFIQQTYVDKDDNA